MYSISFMPKLASWMLLGIACLWFCSCSSARKVQRDKASTTHIGEPVQPPDAEVKYISVYYNRRGDAIRLASKKEDGLLNKKLDNYQYYIGILGTQLVPEVWTILELASGDVRLTSTGVVEGRSPQPLLIGSKYKGKLAIVSGFFNGASIYDARIEAVFEAKPMQLLYQIMEEEKLIIEDYAE